jgi:hypothetical protein
VTADVRHCETILHTQPVSFTGALTLQDALDLHHYRELCLIRPTIRIAIAVLSVTILLGAVFSHYRAGPSAPALFLIAICACCPFGMNALSRLQIRRRFATHPEQFIESTVTISRDAVEVHNQKMDLRLSGIRFKVSSTHQKDCSCSCPNAILCSFYRKGYSMGMSIGTESSGMLKTHLSQLKRSPDAPMDRTAIRGAVACRRPSRLVRGQELHPPPVAVGQR